MTQKKIVIGIGEILWDVFDSQKILGGAPANFAYHAAHAGAEGIAVSAVGNDELGDEIVRTLRKENLPAILQRCEKATGTVRVSLDSAGVADYCFPPDVAWDNLVFTDELRSLAQSGAAAAFGTLARRAPRSRETIRAFLDAMPETALRVCDINLRRNFYSEELLRESAQLADILKVNESELAVLGKFFLKDEPQITPAKSEPFFRKMFGEFPRLKYIVLTCGADGSLIETRNGERSFVPADKTIPVVDTVGAGDAFIATFTVEILNGKTLREAHLRSAKRADFVCSRSGAMC